MYVFVDDSGDPGTKFNQGATRFFVIAAVVFENRETITKAIKAIDQARILGINPETGERITYTREFKYSRFKTRRERKDKFFNAITDLYFSVHAIAIDKSLPYSP